MSVADDRTNPKDIAGRAKVDLSLFPPVAMIHGAHAFMDGAEKYGPFNWREKDVRARVYVAAAMRHLASYLDGEDTAEDSGAHHLGHAIACCAIILDATEAGKIVDDRPVPGSASFRLARLAEDVAERRKAIDESWAKAGNEAANTGAESRRCKICGHPEPVGCQRRDCDLVGPS